MSVTTGLELLTGVGVFGARLEGVAAPVRGAPVVCTRRFGFASAWDIQWADDSISAITTAGRADDDTRVFMVLPFLLVRRVS
jgi:hypothetical protein